MPRMFCCGSAWRAGLAALPILLLGLPGSPALAQGGADGKALFQAKCTGCHTQKRVLDGVRKLPEAERRAHLERFLLSHYAPDAAQRKAICDHLLAAGGG
jgi:mono/diheme cytochrome c family protein